jgi:hypothetical protein
MLSEDLGAVYVRLPGDAWALGAGFAVARAKAPMGGLLAVLSHADEKDRANVPWILLAVVVLCGTAVGVLLSMQEQTGPLVDLVRESEALKAGAAERLDVARLGKAHRLFGMLAENVNIALERVAKAALKKAEHASVRPSKQRPQLPRLGPTDPGTKLPGTKTDSNNAAKVKTGPSAKVQAAVAEARAAAKIAMPASKTEPSAVRAQQASRPELPETAPASFEASEDIDLPTTTMPSKLPVPLPPALAARARETGKNAGARADASGAVSSTDPSAVAPRQDTAESAPPRMDTEQNSVPSGALPNLGSSGVSPRAQVDTERPQSRAAKASQSPLSGRGSQAPGVAQGPEATAVRSAPAEVLSLAIGSGEMPDTTAVVPAPAELLAEVAPVVDEATEWRAVYEDFLRVRKQCGESTAALTFEKFSTALKKHRDALVSSNRCKRVRFAVDVKDGKASLKATPLQA